MTATLGPNPVKSCLVGVAVRVKLQPHLVRLLVQFGQYSLLERPNDPGLVPTIAAIHRARFFSVLLFQLHA